MPAEYKRGRSLQADSVMAMQDTLHALADPTRREILNLLKQSRMSAGDIVKNFSVSGAAISRHLSVLKEAGLIRDEREGKFIYYELILVFFHFFELGTHPSMISKIL